MTLNLIVAADEADVIGRRGVLPWHIPADLRRFRSLTLGHTVVMGRVTYESILDRTGRPLDGRTTIVLTSDDARDITPGVLFMNAGRLAADIAAGWPTGEVFIAGGATVYEQLLPAVQRIHLTRVPGRHRGDRKMPAGWLDPYTVQRSMNRAGIRYETWTRAAEGVSGESHFHLPSTA